MLAELKEYATEVDVDFVRKAVRAIGRCAIKVEVGGDDAILSSDALLFKSLCQLCSSTFRQQFINYLLVFRLRESDNNAVIDKRPPVRFSYSVSIMNTRWLCHHVSAVTVQIN